VATSDSDSSPDASTGTDGAYEKWLVRILLTLAFGLAFGIEGMTLVRSFVLDTETDQNVESREQVPLLQEGDALVPGTAPTVRVQRLRLFATNETWTFTLIARPEAPPERPYTLTFDRLTTTNGTADTTASTHTWAVGDTVAFAASWSLPPGQRPDALTITAAVPGTPDSTAATTRTVDVGHVPVRMQQN
jgi:hypothetical protein